jgi:hypothetical protein
LFFDFYQGGNCQLRQVLLLGLFHILFLFKKRICETFVSQVEEVGTPLRRRFHFAEDGLKYVGILFLLHNVGLGTESDCLRLMRSLRRFGGLRRMMLLLARVSFILSLLARIKLRVN